MWKLGPREHFSITSPKSLLATPCPLYLPSMPTCPWDDDNEAATGGQLADDREVVAEGLCVRDEVRRHCRLGLGLLQAPFQLRDLELGRESRVDGAAWALQPGQEGWNPRGLSGVSCCQGGQGAPCTKGLGGKGGRKKER